MTPTELRREIILDFKRNGISYSVAASRLGYKNKQTVCNLLNSKKDIYFTPSQAKRFHNAFQYNPLTMLTGEGDLIPNDPFSQPAVVFDSFPQKGLKKDISDEKITLEYQIFLLEFLFYVAVKESKNESLKELLAIYTKQIRPRNYTEVKLAVSRINDLLLHSEQKDKVPSTPSGV